jgi:hypothetical protein
VADPSEATICEATGKPHLAIFLNGERVCYWCRRPFETCCEGEAGRETELPPPVDTAESVQSDAEQPSDLAKPAHMIGRTILDRYAAD